METIVKEDLIKINEHQRWTEAQDGPNELTSDEDDPPEADGEGNEPELDPGVGDSATERPNQFHHPKALRYKHC